MTAPPPHLQESQAPVLRRRLLGAAILMVGIYGAGTVGYYVLGGGRWPIGDCAYMTVISLTTVGYGEVLSDIHQIPHARLFTALLLIMGSVIALYSISVLTTFLVEESFSTSDGSDECARNSIGCLDMSSSAEPAGPAHTSPTNSGALNGR